MTKTMITKRQQKKRFLLVLPGLVIPFLFLAFIALGGGKGKQKESMGKELFSGFNAELPDARFDKKDEQKDKLDYYKQADADSIRRKQWMQQDPYHRAAIDTQANLLVKRLDSLKQKIPTPPIIHKRLNPIIPREMIPIPIKREKDTTTVDPELDMLNKMLEKIVQIQQPAEPAASRSLAAEIKDAPDTIVNSLPAIVDRDQVLVPGATIALRFTEAAQINGITYPKDQPVYGVVSISNDRMLINISSIRVDQSIYSASLQVYDLDGLAGIHIPGSLGRETAKQSLEQSIGAMNILPLDLSPTAQVTNAGVQAAKTLLSRKARQVRVMVKAGYQLLLRSTKATVKLVNAVTPKPSDSILALPDPDSFIPFMDKKSRESKMKLTLEGIYLQNDLLWIKLRLENNGPIGFKPEYIRWSTRDRRQVWRTAIQELTMQPLYATSLDKVSGNSSQVLLAAFRPFVLPHDKVLELQVAEGNGSRVLVMEIRDKDLLKAKVWDALNLY